MAYSGRPATAATLPVDAEQQIYRLAIALRQAGISHNDIKNTELLVDQNGTLRLIDFAYATHSRTELVKLHNDGCFNRLQLMLDDPAALLTALQDVRMGRESIALLMNFWETTDTDPIPAHFMVRRRPDELHCAVVWPQPNATGQDLVVSSTVTGLIREVDKRPWKYKLERRETLHLQPLCRRIVALWTAAGLTLSPEPSDDFSMARARCASSTATDRVDVLIIRSISAYYWGSKIPGQPGKNGDLPGLVGMVNRTNDKINHGVQNDWFWLSRTVHEAAVLLEAVAPLLPAAAPTLDYRRPEFASLAGFFGCLDGLTPLKYVVLHRDASIRTIRRLHEERGQNTTKKSVAAGPLPILVNDIALAVVGTGARILDGVHALRQSSSPPSSAGMATHSIRVHGKEVLLALAFVGDAIEPASVAAQQQILWARERVYLDDVIDEEEDWRGPLSCFLE